jgi:hypothetical protein
MRTRRSARVLLTGSLTLALLLLPAPGQAHCDRLDGPVVKAARAALEQDDVTAVLKWVQPKDEAEVRAAFQKTLAVRKAGPEARELADLYFFETVVRLHRAAEGAPYTGLKPAGTDIEPAVEEADRALASGTVDALVKLLTDAAAAGVRARFADVQQKKKHAEHSVEAGREFVAAYVDFVHYVKRLHLDARSPFGHGGEQGARPPHEH